MGRMRDHWESQRAELGLQPQPHWGVTSAEHESALRAPWHRVWARPRQDSPSYTERSDTAEQGDLLCSGCWQRQPGRVSVGGTSTRLWYFHFCLMRPSEPSLPRAIPAQLICACFTMVLIKSPRSPGACVRSSHQKSKQRPGVADSLIM